MTDEHTGPTRPSFAVGSRRLGPDAPCFVIGEVGLGHDGSLGTAHALVDAIADAGADAAKFQTHLAEAESSDLEPWRTPFSYQDERRYDYWVRTGFTAEQWAGLASHCAERGIEFLSSPFSKAAVRLLDGLGVPAWKIASGEVTNWVLIDEILATGRPVILSSGMSTLAELDAAVGRVTRAGVDVAVMQCTTEYPTPPERLGLNLLGELRDRYGCPVGLSDHSGKPYVAVAAATMGAAALELHVTLHRRSFGPDVSSSLTVEELAGVVEGVRALEVARHHPVDKDQRAGELSGLRSTFGQSLVVTVDLPAGTVLDATVLDSRKPLVGIPASRLDEVVGRRLARPVTAGAYLDDADLSPGTEPS